jgi:hypothetical protein
LPQAEIDEALEDDPAAARADYLSEWRDDLATYVPRALIEAAVDRDLTHRPRESGRYYVSYIDANSGGADSFAAAVAHREGDIAVLDAVVEVPGPCNVTKAVETVAFLLKSYGLNTTMGDLHARAWVAAELQRHGISMQDRPSHMHTSEIYLEVLAPFSANKIRLLDHERLINQFCALERRALPGGGERVDHPKGLHDDIAVAASGALWRASKGRATLEVDPAIWGILERYRYRPVGSLRAEAFGRPGVGEREAAKRRRSSNILKRGPR